MVFEGELAVKICAKDVEVGTIAKMETPDKTKSIWARFTVLDLLTTEDLVLGFSIIHQ